MSEARKSLILAACAVGAFFILQAVAFWGAQ